MFPMGFFAYFTAQRRNPLKCKKAAGRKSSGFSTSTPEGAVA
ncbi:hypothetical protein SAMN03159300_11335 [Janthinobacterium sp. 344]|nr:hypothetical protein SAMN03159349_05283 [Janthinobacterium sp. 551a]SFB64976.1 hypothetical protein SAMN03159300_11335 [Janthinobacterium sp. 344]